MKISGVVKIVFGTMIAKIYISIIKPSIDNYITKSQIVDAQIGSNTKIYGKGTIFNSKNLKIGSNSRIGDNYFFHSLGGITIGNNTILSRNVTIYSANHNYLSTELIPYDDTYIEKKVTIGNSVWIGMNVCILPGVTIEDGAIIGMGTIVTKNIKKGEIVVGMGQRVATNRDLEIFEALTKSEKLYGKYGIH
jgi:acetyltransferase-like isoleucine patch superfamily enzyme